MTLEEDAAPAAEVVLTHPLDIGSPAAELAMLDASQEALLDIAPVLDAPGEPLQSTLNESPETGQAGALGIQEPDVAAESSHAQATEAAPGQAEATEEEDDEDRCDYWLYISASHLPSPMPAARPPWPQQGSRWRSCQSHLAATFIPS